MLPFIASLSPTLQMPDNVQNNDEHALLDVEDDDDAELRALQAELAM